MGEYIKHKSLPQAEEIKIGVCYGNKPEYWQTWFNKDTLKKLKEAGFSDWYAREFQSSNMLDRFIENYEDMNVTCVEYASIADVLREYPEYRGILKE